MTKKKEKKQEVERLKKIDKEAIQTQRLRAQEFVDSIPHLQKLIRSFIFYLIKNRGVEFHGIPSEKIHSTVLNLFKSRVKLFYETLESEGYILNDDHKNLLEQKFLSESKSIRYDIFNIIKNREEEDKILKRQPDFETINKEIDKLLVFYGDWE